jgi:hypothetical protein
MDRQPVQRHGGRQGGGGVHDQQVAGEQQVRQITEAVVAHRSAVAPAHEQPYGVAGPGAGAGAFLGRLMRLQRGREREVVHREIRHRGIPARL